MNICPCCSSTLLRHARHDGVYWFCRHCWQEMPECSALSSVSLGGLSRWEYSFSNTPSAINEQNIALI